MKESWRWYGPFDRITLTEVAQTGASGIVNALHEIPYGEVWGSDAIAARRDEIADSGLGLTWNVVESLPIHEDIKRGEGDLERLFSNYRQSMKNLADAGIHTICYNFMPLLDWTRTQLDAPVARGGTALRFSEPHMAAFEIHMLERDGAENDYSPEVREAAKAWFDASSEGLRQNLLNSIMSGLPGAFDRYDISGLREALKRYHGISRDEIRANYARFLAEVIPTAEELGMRFCVHPDDPPRDILGLPRIVSCEDDIAWIMEQQPALANGLTLCAGSLGANPKNDVPAIAARFAERIHFAHLRNVAKEKDGSFQEAAHLDGDTDMVTLIAVLIAEERRRKADGRADFEIPFRPDHGHELLDDVSRGTHPGYPLVGRLRGLAELRGVIRALSHGHVHYG
ncbi:MULTISPECIES: mannonate dehydratase [Rhizobium/Agrobacterium group]|uniref:Mannonate dehydratase n=2 Tax=Rhizobium/Agrobacterium group TaxID=227290 RepID=B9JSX0_ALLAM|nr:MULTISPECIES: mannonate dehydratase [Rhizobium/Agrobacterium group]ACM37813.1 mannonate dehydratase [Allorhizobium ampelinum S4]MCF1447460.1 mannonate dehydratase [Allorhizobium ampelinum]MUO29277.1 mannonate dehydratase [Agrobacterium vitis]MUO43729.1 mannonate dehydratase [Agrobacterium vitis]MUP12454.1 mannonate dehydratase [Agrobacterium vitis]